MGVLEFRAMVPRLFAFVVTVGFDLQIRNFMRNEQSGANAGKETNREMHDKGLTCAGGGERDFGSVLGSWACQ